MAAIPAAAWLVMGTTALTAGTQYAASKQSEINEQAAAVATARRAEAAAKEAEAAGQLKSNEARRRADIMASRALAVAAASGAGTSGIETLMTGFAEAGERAAGEARYESVEAGKGLRDRAQLGLYQAEGAGRAAKVERSATALGAVAQGASIYSKYGGGDADPYRTRLQEASRQYAYD